MPDTVDNPPTRVIKYFQWIWLSTLIGTAILVVVGTSMAADESPRLATLIGVLGAAYLALAVIFAHELIAKKRNWARFAFVLTLTPLVLAEVYLLAFFSWRSRIIMFIGLWAVITGLQIWSCLLALSRPMAAALGAPAYGRTVSGWSISFVGLLLVAAGLSQLPPQSLTFAFKSEDPNATCSDADHLMTVRMLINKQSAIGKQYAAINQNPLDLLIHTKLGSPIAMSFDRDLRRVTCLIAFEIDKSAFLKKLAESDIDQQSRRFIASIALLQGGIAIAAGKQSKALYSIQPDGQGDHNISLISLDE